MTFIFTFLMLLSFWFIISGTFNWFLSSFAIIFCLIAAYLSHDFFLHKLKKKYFRTAREFIGYLPWLIKETIVANFQIAKIVLSPSLKIDPVMVEFTSTVKTDLGLTILANSITITPGTVTVDIQDGRVFLIHALSKEHEEAVLSLEIEKKVLKIIGTNNV